MLNILYENPHIRVLNKPANIALLADRQSPEHIWAELKASGEKPYLVHRLDKGTSGVLLIARDQATQTALTRAFNARQIGKYYLAWVVGEFPTEGTYRIDLPLCKGRKSRYRIAGERQKITLHRKQFTVEQDRNGLAATTLARCLQHRGAHSLMLLKPITGRTHQIRVHLSWLNYPIVGDQLYGQPSQPLQRGARLLLHCHRLVVPGWGSFVAPLEDFMLNADADPGPSDH